MARLFVTGINLNKNELQNARIQNLNAAPSSPVAGQIYYNNVDNIMYFYNGTEWISTSGSLEVIQDAIGAYVSGGTGLTSSYNDTTGVTTIDLDNTTVSAGSYGSESKTSTFTVDAQGRLTVAGETAIQISTSQVTGLEEYIEDTVGDSIAGLVKEGEGIDVVYDDPNGTLTISAEDATSSNKGIASFDSTDFTVTSGAVTLNVERVEDIAANLIVDGTGLDKSYNDGDGVLTLSIDSTVVTKDGIQTLTNKTLGAGTSLNSDLDAGAKKITNLASPIQAGDAATKGYVDALAEGLHIHASVAAATTENLSSDWFITPGVAFTSTIDGIALQNGDRVLVKNQNNTAENGIYVASIASTYVSLSRASDYDTANEIQAGDFVFVYGGATYNSTGWVQENPVTTLGTDPIVWDQFSGAGTYSAGGGLTLNGTEFSVDVTPNAGFFAGLEISQNALNVKADTGRGLSINANGLGVNAGVGFVFSPIDGTLINDINNGYGVRKKAFNVGTGAALGVTTHVITHNLGSRDVTVNLYQNASPFAQVEADVEHTDSNTVTLKFATAPDVDEYRVVIVG